MCLWFALYFFFNDGLNENLFKGWSYYVNFYYVKKLCKFLCNCFSVGLIMSFKWPFKRDPFWELLVDSKEESNALAIVNDWISILTISNFQYLIHYSSSCLKNIILQIAHTSMNYFLFDLTTNFFFFDLLLNS